MFSRSFRRAGAILLALVTVAGCRPRPPDTRVAPVAPTPLASAWPAPPTAPAPLSADIPDSGASGMVNGRPFFVRSATFWQDATAAWIDFDANVPVLDGHYDPTARRPPATAFMLYLTLDPLKPGSYSADSRTPPNRNNPIAGAALQIGDKNGPIYRKNWRVHLVIEAIASRSRRDGGPAETDLLGKVSIVFPQGYVIGRFLANDTIPPENVAPGAPPVPTPPIYRGKTD